MVDLEVSQKKTIFLGENDFFLGENDFFLGENDFFSPKKLQDILMSETQLSQTKTTDWTVSEQTTNSCWERHQYTVPHYTIETYNKSRVQEV